MAAPLRRHVMPKSSVFSVFCKANRRNVTIQFVPQKRFHHSVRGSAIRLCVGNQHQVLSPTRHWQKIASVAVRHASTDGATPGTATGTQFASIPDGYIPDIPTVPVEDLVVSLVDLNSLGEPTLTSLGLTSYFPPGLFLQGLEMLHVSLDVPWWCAISMAVVILRSALFPLMVKQRRNMVNLNNHMPTVTRLQERISEAKRDGNKYEVAAESHELAEYLKRNNIKYSYMFLPALQVPIFISVFMGLRRMSDLPVDSLKTGGFGWVTDLTLADPFYILPIVTSCTMLAIIELGAEGARAQTLTHTMKWVMRGIPVMVLVLTANFPAAMGMYWVTNNFVSLIQSQMFKVPAVKRALKIPEEVKHVRPVRKSKGLVEGFRDSYDNARIASAVSNRRQAEEELFKNAGKGPVPKTYAYNPTLKQRASNS